MSTVDRARAALLARFSGPVDSDGYTDAPEHNLIQGIDFSAVEPDLRRGDGDELSGKFRAVHSSSALAVNCFGRFKRSGQELGLLGTQGAVVVEFEKRLPIFRGGRPPNLDVWIEREGDIIAVESKLLEYLTPKRPGFSAAYDRLKPPRCEPLWWQQYQSAKDCAVAQHLDRAQLLKHYFGLNEYRRKHTRKPLTLFYIFWEPLNSHELEECRRLIVRNSRCSRSLSPARTSRSAGRPITSCGASGAIHRSLRATSQTSWPAINCLSDDDAQRPPARQTDRSQARPGASPRAAGA